MTPLGLSDLLDALGIELVLMPSVVGSADSSLQRFGQHLRDHGVGRTEIPAGAHKVDHLVDRSVVHDAAPVQHCNQIAQSHGGEGGDDAHGVGVDGDGTFFRHARAPKVKS